MIIVLGFKITILHISTHIPNIFLERRMREFTQFYLNRLSQNKRYVLNIIDCKTIDDGLSQLTDTDYVFIISSGNRIYHSNLFLDKVLQPFMDDPSLGLMGHILDRKDQWFELHPQFVVFDYKKWVDIGRPTYGNKEDSSESIVSIIRSESNIHDDYTPHWVKLEKPIQYNEYDILDRGWDFINSFLLNDYNISPFNDDIRGLKAYCYPEYNSDKFFELIDNKRYSDEIDYTKRILLHSLLNSPDKTLLFNTEEMCIMKEKTDITYDVVALPCAGFKFLDLLHSDLIHEKSKIVFFDFSESSVEWINYVINSEELTITDLVLNKPEEVKLIGKTIEKLSVDGIPSNDLIRLSEEVYSFYGGINNFMRLLKKFRTLNIEIINTDIINDPLNCLHRLNGDNNLINISNIFSTDYFNLFYSEKERTDKFERFIKTLNRSTTVVGRGVDTYYSEKSYNNG